MLRAGLCSFVVQTPSMCFYVRLMHLQVVVMLSNLIFLFLLVFPKLRTCFLWL